MPRYTPQESDRCMFVTLDGKRCRSARLQGEGNSLCYFHFRSAARKAEKREPHPVLVASEILPADQPLDNAQAVNAVLTRMFRTVADGRLSPRQAGSLAYLGQVILMSLPHMRREAELAPPPSHILGRDPDAVIAELAAALQQAIKPAGSPEESSTGSKAQSG